MHVMPAAIRAFCLSIRTGRSWEEPVQHSSGRPPAFRLRARRPGPASSERGRDRPGRDGIMEANEQVTTFPPLPRDDHPPAGHALPGLPPHGRAPARRHQRGPDRALPPRPSRSARPRVPVTTPRSPHDNRRRLPARARPRPKSGPVAPVVTERYCHCVSDRTRTRRYARSVDQVQVDRRQHTSFIMRVRADRGAAGCLRVGHQDLIDQRRVPGAQRLIEAPDGGLGFGHAFAG